MLSLLGGMTTSRSLWSEVEELKALMSFDIAGAFMHNTTFFVRVPFFS